jgi:protein gp37
VADHSAIEWTDATWNPVTGCDRVSPGCAHCYALDLASRLKRMGNVRYQNDGDPKSSGPGFGVTLHPDVLKKPLNWRKPRRVFVNSMSDLFHEEVPDEYIAEVFGVMAAAPQHTFQVLTKRPERMRDLLTDDDWVLAAFEEASSWVKRPGLSLDNQDNYLWPAKDYHEFPALRNVWLGVSIENRRFVDRADLLRETPAAVRFISAEPLLGPLVHNPFFPQDWRPLSLVDIDWLIVGGESGPKHRRINKEWVRDLQCACRGERRGPEDDEVMVPKTAFFFKQWGGRTPKTGGRELDGRTWDEFPQTAEVAA